jgi:hypothetical protein
MNPCVMKTSQLSENDFDDEFYSKECMNLMKFYKISLKELTNIKLEKESLVTKFSESYALIDSLKSKNIVLVENIKSLKNELKDSNGPFRCWIFEIIIEFLFDLRISR